MNKSIIEIAEKIGAKVINAGKVDCEFNAVFCGDLLSYVMSSAPARSIWLTVMNGINVAAVAEYADIAAVVICGGTEPRKELCDKAMERGITLLATELDVFGAAMALGAEN